MASSLPIGRSPASHYHPSSPPPALPLAAAPHPLAPPLSPHWPLPCISLPPLIPPPLSPIGRRPASPCPAPLSPLAAPLHLITTPHPPPRSLPLAAAPHPLAPPLSPHWPAPRISLSLVIRCSGRGRSRHGAPPAPPLLLLLLWATALGGAQELVADNVTVLEGDAAELTCHLHGYDGSIVVIQNPARQTLFFNGTRALKDERFQLLEFSRRRLRVRLSPARLEDEGGYSCQLYGEDTRHQSGALTVLVPPAEPEVTQGGVAVAGAELELRCLVPRARPPAALRWYRDRRELGGVPSREQRGLVFAQLNVLRLRVERGDNGATVTCEVTHPALPRGQRRRAQLTLDVQYPPSVRIQVSPRVLREGDTLVLSCSVTGNPPPTDVSWSRSNGSLPVPGRAEQRAGPWGAELRVPDLGPGDNGDTYSCSAGNAHGRGSASVALRVHAAGAVLATPQATPFAIVGGVLALLVFLLLCLLGALLWCSVRQKGSYLTHEASGLDEPGEAREAFLGGDGGKRREEFFI